jgi:hypothetical protein
MLDLVKNNWFSEPEISGIISMKISKRIRLTVMLWKTAVHGLPATSTMTVLGFQEIVVRLVLWVVSGTLLLGRVHAPTLVSMLRRLSRGRGNSTEV